MSEPFEPDSASPPGETIRDMMAERGIGEYALAQRLGVRAYVVAELLAGERRITPYLAECLGIALGPSAEFWREREAQYRADLRRLGRIR